MEWFEVQKQACDITYDMCYNTVEIVDFYVGDFYVGDFYVGDFYVGDFYVGDFYVGSFDVRRGG